MIVVEPGELLGAEAPRRRVGIEVHDRGALAVLNRDSFAVRRPAHLPDGVLVLAKELRAVAAVHERP